ncbi:MULTISPECIES: ArsR/SmtB family transcription factor [Streptomyces]|uniref:ArsR family transcriptional regulator n=2 Tax=Streptomyces TaxID=1883 RepID=A0A3R7IXN4_9ACTN|nr:MULTISPECIES: helix-turn-helix domain-containing protein [Streptomyces]KNE83032.1 ArsR family transcriptional regulator [Streptomyces fradiae]OFA52952.1 ArsR family transcriptional regulator [Streptomyces fradiae]PQM20498.1 ArsR family transcriptional regulator [Streptomyces xinghaiensis]RKM91307.1 ArsR family transcriptional regulator [Streptomyces xinghaiensis]RNC69802.1 ArsR family transcriptional regulator [Streptomyces xinghaiensis]
MELEERVTELERRLAELEEMGSRKDRPAITERPDFWALDGLRAQLSDAGVESGGVLFTGSVRLPTGGQYEWQYGLPTDQLLAGSWEDAAEAFAALGRPVRLRLLREILGGRRTAAELTELAEVGTTGQVYHHLRQLTAAGWLRSSGRAGYEVPADRVVPLLVVLAAAEH